MTMRSLLMLGPLLDCEKNLIDFTQKGLNRNRNGSHEKLLFLISYSGVRKRKRPLHGLSAHLSHEIKKVFRDFF
jgi:hypothetical protein